MFQQSKGIASTSFVSDAVQLEVAVISLNCKHAKHANNHCLSMKYHWKDSQADILNSLIGAVILIQVHPVHSTVPCGHASRDGPHGQGFTIPQEPEAEQRFSAKCSQLWF